MLRLTTKQILSYIIWAGILLLAAFLFVGTNYIFSSVLLFLFVLFEWGYATYYTHKSSNIYFFSPIFQTMYCSLFYCLLIGLFYFSKYNFIEFFRLPTSDSGLLFQISVIYFIFLSAIFAPYVVCLLFNFKPRINFKVLKHNFSLVKLERYLKISLLVLIVLLGLIFISTGYNPISALLNPSEFRYEYSHGIANVFYRLFNVLTCLNLLIVLKNLLIDKIRVKKIKLLNYAFLGFYLFWTIISGARSYIVIPLIYSAYCLSFIKNLKINLKQILILIFSVAFTLLFAAGYFMYRNYMQNVQSGKVQKLTKEVNVVYSSIERIDNFANSVMYFVHVNRDSDLFNFNNFHLKKQFVSQFQMFIPRSVIPDKGYPISGELTKLIYPEAFRGNVNLIFGGLTNLFHTGGVGYVVIDALLFGLFLAIMEFSFKYLIQYDLFLLIYLLIFLDIPIMYFYTGFINSEVIFSLLIKFFIVIPILYLLIEKPRGGKLNG